MREEERRKFDWSVRHLHCGITGGLIELEQKEVIKSGRKRNNVGAEEDCHSVPSAAEENDVPCRRPQLHGATAQLLQVPAVSYCTR